MDLKIHAPLPGRKDFRIGILGSGFIVNDCHLVAYRKAGFNPVAIASRKKENAERVARRHNIGTVSDGYDQLLDDPSIEVLDIAVPPNTQLGLIKAACARKTVKGILAQKPLGMNYAEAVEAVHACEAAGIKLAVNQNMRYDHSVRAAKTLLESGTLGEPVFATIEMRAIPHWMPWQKDLGWLTLRIMSIHHLDTFRYWFGEPEGIYCSVRTDPRTQFPHTDGICTYILEYANGLRCVAIDDTWAGPAKEGCPGDNYIRWRIEGTNGLALGDIGWCKEPFTSPSTIRYAGKGDREFHEPRWLESWFPDAFIGPMAQLLIALENGTEPAISGRDNLKTMALVEGAYESAKQRRIVTSPEVLGNAYPNYTERAQQALAFARNEARSLQHELVGSHHLLAGLLRLGSGVAFTMLTRLDVELATIQAQIVQEFGRGTSQQIRAEYPEELRRVLSCASRTAINYRQQHVGTEHLFFGIVSEEACCAARLLRSLGVENTTLRDEIVRELFGG